MRMNNIQSCSKPHKVGKRIDRAADSFSEKLHRMNIPEDRKQSIIDNFSWLLQTRHECREIWQAELLDTEIDHMINLMDSLSSCSKLVSPMAVRELAATNFCDGLDASKPQTSADQAAIPKDNLCSFNRELLQLQAGDHTSVHFEPYNSDKLVDVELDNRKMYLAVETTEKEPTAQLFAGAGICPRDAELTMEGVEATAELSVRLDSVRKLMETMLLRGTCNDET